MVVRCGCKVCLISVRPAGPRRCPGGGFIGRASVQAASCGALVFWGLGIPFFGIRGRLVRLVWDCCRDVFCSGQQEYFCRIFVSLQLNLIMMLKKNYCAKVRSLGKKIYLFFFLPHLFFIHDYRFKCFERRFAGNFFVGFL